MPKGEAVWKKWRHNPLFLQRGRFNYFRKATNVKSNFFKQESEVILTNLLVDRTGSSVFGPFHFFQSLSQNKLNCDSYHDITNKKSYNIYSLWKKSKPQDQRWLSRTRFGELRVDKSVSHLGRNELASKFYDGIWRYLVCN